MWSITNSLLIGSSFNVILRLITNVEDRSEKGLCNILFGVHHINVVRNFEVLEIGKLREGGGVPSGGGGGVGPSLKRTMTLAAINRSPSRAPAMWVAIFIGSSWSG
jgi:hypothetical protein